MLLIANRRGRPGRGRGGFGISIGSGASANREGCAPVGALCRSFRQICDICRKPISASSKSDPSHQWPVLGIEVHGSLGGSGAPFCNNSMDCLSGERTNAITPSRGGRLMVTPCARSRSQVA